MKLFVKCERCAGDLAVDAQTVANASALGQELVLEHDVCPGQEPLPAPTLTVRRFRMQMLVVELPPPGDEEYERLGVKEADAGQSIDWTPEWRVAPGVEHGMLEPILGIGKTVEARNAAEAVNGPLTGWLSDAWSKMMENAAWADAPAATTAT